MKWLVGALFVLILVGWLWVLYTVDWSVELEEMERELQEEQNLLEK